MFVRGPTIGDPWGYCSQKDRRPVWDQYVPSRRFSRQSARDICSRAYFFLIGDSTGRLPSSAIHFRKLPSSCDYTVFEIFAVKCVAKVRPTDFGGIYTDIPPRRYAPGTNAVYTKLFLKNQLSSCLTKLYSCQSLLVFLRHCSVLYKRTTKHIIKRSVSAIITNGILQITRNKTLQAVYTVGPTSQ